MKAEPLSFFDRVAIGFGATIMGGAAAFAFGFIVLYVITHGYEYFGISDSQFFYFNALLLWTVPIRFGLFFGVVGFFSPKIAGVCIGKVWDAVNFLWR